jgi:hypothetical protein
VSQAAHADAADADEMDPLLMRVHSIIRLDTTEATEFHGDTEKCFMNTFRVSVALPYFRGASVPPW